MHIHKCPSLIPWLVDAKVKKGPHIRLQHAMLLEFFLPADFCLLRLWLPCNHIHIHHPYFLFFSAVLLLFHSPRGQWKRELLGEREGNHI